jgi:glycosyltransferase involved in cell wall biosynthesis
MQPTAQAVGGSEKRPKPQRGERTIPTKYMRTPLISVLIDTYNQEPFIEQAIVSVLDQDFPAADMEIIVVDDGSTDRTAEIVSKFEPRVRLIRKPNGGQASAFNAAIPEAKADIVAFLDGDDWWAQGKVKAVTEAFETHPTIAAVGHGYYEVANGKATGEIVAPKTNCVLDMSSVEAARVAELGRMLLGTSRLAVRRDILHCIGPIPDELVFCADTPILTLVLALGGALILREPLCYYRLHTGNLFAAAGMNEAKLRRMLQIRKFLQQLLPQMLAAVGVPREVIEAHMESDAIQLQRLTLQFEGGTRRQTLQTERHNFQRSYKNPTFGYKLFHNLTLALALTLSPKHFYNLRSWYSKRLDLHRLRSMVGEVEDAVALELFERRVASSSPDTP